MNLGFMCTFRVCFLCVSLLWEPAKDTEFYGRTAYESSDRFRIIYNTNHRKKLYLKNRERHMLVQLHCKPISRSLGSAALFVGFAFISCGDSNIDKYSQRKSGMR